MGETKIPSETLALAIYAIIALAGIGLLARKGYKRPNGIRDLYQAIQPAAHYVKSWLQMAIGVIAVVVTGGQLLSLASKAAQHESSQNAAASATGSVLESIGLALAVAAVVELAYTLFTDGPDEVLDPLMLAISATMIVEVSKEFDFQRAAALALLGPLLGFLFLVRLFLAERHEQLPPEAATKTEAQVAASDSATPSQGGAAGEDIKIWWVRLLISRLDSRTRAWAPTSQPPTATSDPLTSCDPQ